MVSLEYLDNPDSDSDSVSGGSGDSGCRTYQSVAGRV